MSACVRVSAFVIVVVLNVCLSVQVRVAEVVCEPGTYCVEGVRIACPAGQFGDVSGLATAGEWIKDKHKEGREETKQSKAKQSKAKQSKAKQKGSNEKRKHRKKKKEKSARGFFSWQSLIPNPSHTSPTIPTLPLFDSQKTARVRVSSATTALCSRRALVSGTAVGPTSSVPAARGHPATSSEGTTALGCRPWPRAVSMTRSTGRRGQGWRRPRGGASTGGNGACSFASLAHPERVTKAF